MSLYDNTELPDSIEPILAIRGWNIYQENNKYFLSSCFQYKIIWPFKTKLSALCLANDSWMSPGIKHTAPLQDCDCGIYALKKAPDEHELLPWEEDSILGLVFIWGKILEGTKGYRAQFSKPAALLQDERSEIISSLAQNYSVPVVEDLNISADSLPFQF